MQMYIQNIHFLTKVSYFPLSEKKENSIYVWRKNLIISFLIPTGKNCRSSLRTKLLYTFIS